MTDAPARWPRLLSAREAAEYLGVSVNHFKGRVPVPAVAIGARRLWDRAALNRWVDSLGGQVSADALRNEILERLHDRAPT